MNKSVTPARAEPRQLVPLAIAMAVLAVATPWLWTRVLFVLVAAALVGKAVWLSRQQGRSRDEN